MKQVEIGSRKYRGFIWSLLAFFLISVAVLVISLYTTPDEKVFDVQAYSALFIPLGTGIVMIGSLFYFGNTLSKFTKNDK